ncbi:hypothetical protein C343_04580 [Cryptococcus neoformans C23]|nr:hypothetical protein C347_04627 [Cryptococcus neoformans var. grubii AD2-60a]OWZ38304.1 hypothetical protein C353_04480 [Cryptococcus neoformans var. grubii AD1-83a]OWZ42060.1 hypothetical protein C343_04580 [Cryptococcus neoformans var. grubii C23]OWZ53084.1 hypothetical protein C368_04653 [Cryptococcus neoformans var. grubii 125.91]OXC83427.1 hypothetical protein C344_04307 [Cryptococcus neoformans var. grubii AD1-7a]OXG48339.1 hypothetical protein C355_04286 [Cryptococcus neoformans var.
MNIRPAYWIELPQRTYGRGWLLMWLISLSALATPLSEFNGRHSSAIGGTFDQSNCAEDAACCAYFVYRTNICSQRLLRIRHHSGTPRPVSLHTVILVAMLIVWQQPLPVPPLCKPREVIPVEVVREGVGVIVEVDAGAALVGPLPPARLGEEMPVRCWPRHLLVARRKGKMSGRLFGLRRGLGGDVCCKYCI